MPGEEPISKEQYCKENPDSTAYYMPTGFRRIPLTTCHGGTEFDKQTERVACPGHEEEFERERQASGVGIFFAVTVPVAVACAVGWYVWKHWKGKFG